jgi:hypothetical protein
VSITTSRSLPSLFRAIAIEGRVRRLRGSDEVQTAQRHPSVGTPIEVPLPRTMISAFMRLAS